MPLNKTADRELKAIGIILAALDNLDGDSIQRVFDYVFSRLSIGGARLPRTAVPSAGVSGLESSEQRLGRAPSIRDLKDEKQPESLNQMAALVAYYLSEMLTGDERKGSITTADLERYFKQAGFKLPKQMSMTLPNATAAGYFDALGNGIYKLNPVGYNLICRAPATHYRAGKPKDARNARPRNNRNATLR
jgi:hypothetical protein